MPPKPSAAVSPVSPAMQRTVPGTSNRRRPCGRTCSTSQTAAAIVPTIPIGTLNQNTVRQPKLVSQPPRIGPRTWPTPMIIALMPSARPSSRRGNASVTRAAEFAISSAPPTPWRTRPPISRRSVGARAQPMDAIVNTANPSVYDRARPIWSAIVPAFITRTVATRV